MSIKDFKIDFDSKTGLMLGEYKFNDTAKAKAYGVCSYGSECGGGGGQCSYGSQCSGGGGVCSYGSRCSGQ